MLRSTLSYLRCPAQKKNRSCGGNLAIESSKEQAQDVESGHLHCDRCKSKFPILGGVAILTSDVRRYLTEHAKGISQLVSDSDIPREFRKAYLSAKAEIQIEHIEEDLEAERVNALYVMNHYLQTQGPQGEWWKPTSPLIDKIVRENWDNGPFAQIETWAEKMDSGPRILELGCGVGGLCRKFKRAGFYLGIDSSFASIALARHLNMGARYPRPIKIPGDLLQGPVSRTIELQVLRSEQADFVVGDLENVPVESGQWDGVITLNAIDMLEDPSLLPRTHHALLNSGGFAIQSCPYIWHEFVAERLRAEIPREIKDSAAAITWLYQKSGFKILEKFDHLPWLFFKHFRQIEVYSVHLFKALKP